MKDAQGPVNHPHRSHKILRNGFKSRTLPFQHHPPHVWFRNHLLQGQDATLTWEFHRCKFLISIVRPQPRRLLVAVEGHDDFVEFVWACQPSQDEKGRRTNDSSLWLRPFFFSSFEPDKTIYRSIEKGRPYIHNSPLKTKSRSHRQRSSKRHCRCTTCKKVLSFFSI